MDTTHRLIMHLRLIEEEYRFLKKRNQPFNITDYPGIIRRAHTLLDHRRRWRNTEIERVEKAGFLMCLQENALIVLIDCDPIVIPLDSEVYRSQPPLTVTLKKPMWWECFNTTCAKQN